MRRSLQSSRDKSRNGSILNPTHLQLTLAIEEYILGLDIAVGNTLGVEVRNSQQYLPEATFDFTRSHASLLDRRIEIATRAEFHNFAPVLIFVLNKIDGLDDVDVV